MTLVNASTVELWSDWSCVAGATKIGDVRIVDGREGPQLDNSDAFSATVIPDARVALALRQVVRVTDPLGQIREYRIQSLGRTLSDRRRNVSAVGPLRDLGLAGLVRTVSGGVASYAVGGTYTVTQFIDTFVLSNLSTDGVSWLARGTVDPTATYTITAPATGWTRLQWLQELANRTGAELRLRRNGSTSYLIDLLTSTGSTASVVPVASGKNIVALSETGDDAELATAVSVFGDANGGSPASIGENLWTLGTIPGSAPFWLPLTDPAGGAGPVAFASQFGTGATSQTAYLLTTGGTLVQVTDSRITPDNAVLVAATAGLVAGERVQFVSDNAATRLIELRSPGTSRLHRTDSVSGGRGEANLAQNGSFAVWTSDTAAQNWTGTAAKYARTTPTSLTLTITANAANLTAVSVSGPANALVCKGDIFTAAGGPTGSVWSTSTVRLDGSGVGTLALSDVTGSTAYAATAGATLTFGTLSNRPASFPADGLSTDCARIARTDSILSAAWRVKYVAGLPYVAAAVGWTHALGVTGPATAASLGTLDIRNTLAGTTLASVTPATDLPVSTTRHETTQVAALLSVDTTVAIRLTGTTSLYASSIARWAWLWLSPSASPSVPEPLTGSFANALWQRANRALLARALSSRQVQVSLRDLSTAAGYSVSRETLTLGGLVSLEDLGTRVRVVGLSYSLTDPTDVNVVIDARPTRLTQYLAERL